MYKRGSNLNVENQIECIENTSRKVNICPDNEKVAESSSTSDNNAEDQDIIPQQIRSDWVNVVKRNIHKSVQKPVLCGTNSASKLKVIQKEPRKKAVFVSRLAPDITVNDITQHLEHQNLKFIKITQLKTKYDTYASFHIEVEEQKFEEVFSEKYWPEGCFVSQFYGKLRSEQIYESAENMKESSQ